MPGELGKDAEKEKSGSAQRIRHYRGRTLSSGMICTARSELLYYAAWKRGGVHDCPREKLKFRLIISLSGSIPTGGSERWSRQYGGKELGVSKKKFGGRQKGNVWVNAESKKKG